MKKLLAIALVAIMALSMAACGETAPATDASTAPTGTTAPATEATDAVMTYAEYMAADLETEVTVECYVQGHQSWWEDKITVYAQDADGGYFLYELACTEEDAANLNPGTKIRVTGTKSEWSGEIEIVDATFTFVEDADPFVANTLDVTAMVGTDDLIKHQNERVFFKGMTIKTVEYKNGEPGDDIYVTASVNGTDVNFCVEAYLTDPNSTVYKTVGTLKEGDVMDIEAFLYWYEGANPHITSIAKAI